LCAGPVSAIELKGQFLVEMRAVSADTRAEVVEHLHWQAFRIGWGLQHERRHGGDQYGSRDALWPMAPDVAVTLAPARGMTHQWDLVQVERLDDGREVVGVTVHVVAGGRLVRPAVAPPV